MNSDEAAQAFSSQLSPAFEAMVNDLLAQRGGGLVQSYLGIANYMNSEGEQCWAFIAGDGQTVQTSAGIVVVLERIVDAQLNEALFGE